MLEGEKNKGEEKGSLSPNSTTQVVKHLNKNILLPAYRQCDNPNQKKSYQHNITRFHQKQENINRNKTRRQMYKCYVKDDHTSKLKNRIPATQLGIIINYKILLLKENIKKFIKSKTTQKHVSSRSNQTKSTQLKYHKCIAT